MICIICLVVKFDIVIILYFICEFVIYEKVEYEVKVIEEYIYCILFNEQLKVYVIICEFNGEVIGFVVYFFSYFIW